MKKPICPVHGERMQLRQPGTQEQEYCGTWYVCGVAGCEYTVLLPSPELAATLGVGIGAARQHLQADEEFA